MIPPVRRAQQMMSVFVEVGWDSDRAEAPGPVRLRLRLRGVCQLRRHECRVWQDGQGLPEPSARRPHERPDPHLLLRTRGRPQVSPVRLGTRAFGRGEPARVRESITTTAPRPSVRTCGKPAGGTRRASASKRQAIPTTQPSHQGKLGTAGTIPSPWRTILPTTAMPWSPSNWTGGSTAKCRETTSPTDNKRTGVKITHFPVIHARKGSIGYKLEWTPRSAPTCP